MSLGRRIKQFFRGGDLSGSSPNPKVVKIQGRAVQDANPSDGQVLKWVSANSQYEPATIGASSTDLTQNVALSGDISPAQITADQNDYNPTGLSTASTLRLSSDASRNITGLQGGADGRLLIVHNIGSQNTVLKDESASSSAANRFALNADVTIGGDQAALMQYDSTSSRWRLVAGPSAAGGGGSIAPLQLTDANTVEQYNGTTNQVHRLYATRTSTTNYEALKTSFDSGNGAFKIEAEKGGAGGSFRNIFIVVSGGIYQFQSAAFVPPGDDAANLGSGSNYWNEVFGDHYILKSSNSRVRWAGSTRLIAPANGIIQIKDDSENGGSGTLQFDARTPSTITSNQNNYSIPVPGYFVRLATDASRDITGIIVSASNRDGQIHLLVNVGSNNIVLKHQDTNSTATNRFLNSTGADITLSADQAAEIIYDGITQRWRVFKRN